MKKVECSLFVDFDTSAHQGMNHVDSTPGESYSGFDHNVIELTVNRLCRKTPEPFGEELVVSEKVYESEEAYLVVVRYTTGGTFGQSEGEYRFIGVFKTRKEATALSKEIQKAYDDYKRNNSGKYSFVPETENPNYKEIYCSWHGYFEHLDRIEIHSLGIDD